MLWSALQSPLVAGEWNSGGGEFLADSLNPWFIQNTKIVTYCIEIDDNAFHLGDARTRRKKNQGAVRRLGNETVTERRFNLYFGCIIEQRFN